MSIERLKADKEAASLKEDVQRLTELKKFLSTGNNPGNRTRVKEIEEQLARIQLRLEHLEQIP